MTQFLILFSALFLQFNAFAESTNPELAQRLEEVLGKYVVPGGNNKADNRYSSTLFGVTRETIAHHFTFTCHHEEKIPTAMLESGFAPVQLHLVRDEKKNVKPAPLAILLNPMFSGVFEGQMVRFLDFFAARGYHVAVFMNTWSKSITDQKPKFFPGDVIREASLNMELIDYVVNNKIGRANITGATMVGLSYGAFMSSVVKSIDSHRENPLIDGPTLVLEAPTDISRSAENIDRQLEEVAADTAKCTKANISFFAQMLIHSDFNKISNDENCAKQLFLTVGFHDRFHDMLRKFNDAKKLGLSEEQLKSMTFKSYVDGLVKQNVQPGYSDVGYWISDAQKTGYNKFLVLTTLDDNINEGTDLRTNAYARFDNSNLIVLPRGGHTGFRAMKSSDPTCGADWTDCFLKAVYR